MEKKAGAKGSSDYLELLSVEEGCFKNGRKHGYCRIFDSNNGVVECGYFEEDVPCGKYVKWSNDEELQEEGIFESSKLTQRVSIDNFVSNI
mmetsp:Transcript_16529/g.28087  ORF Transcript_16529/g.28087 Transcript_16529/m.28087 type:complete len:91 (-) Transcript_16529:21-293(-)